MDSQKYNVRLWPMEKNLFKNFFMTLQSFKHNKVYLHLYSVQKCAFYRICGEKSCYYSFTGPHNRIPLHNGIEGNCLRHIMIILIYLIYNKNMYTSLSFIISYFT